MGIEIAILLALVAFLLLFVSIDNQIKKNEREKTLKHKKSWIDYKRTLPKYVP